tara:strand:- start:200 stop:409 length:210 start_codon:yes stop_codon:yes gene_type:complete
MKPAVLLVQALKSKKKTLKQAWWFSAWCLEHHCEQKPYGLCVLNSKINHITLEIPLRLLVSADFLMSDN